MDFGWMNNMYGYGLSGVNLGWYDYLSKTQKAQNEKFLELFEKLIEETFSQEESAGEDRKEAMEVSKKEEGTKAGEQAAFANKKQAASRLTRENPAAVLHGVEKDSQDTQVAAWADMTSGISATVYKPQGFDSENPVYKVKVWDRAGNVTERVIDISKVDVRSCDAIEMYAYAAHMEDSGVCEGALRRFMAARAQSRNNFSEVFDNMNWMEAARTIAQAQYEAGNLNGYMEWKRFLEKLGRNFS